MTALPAVKREALRFRIWQFAAPREWNVTIAEIAEAIGEPWLRVRNTVVNAGWSNRVRSLTGSPTDSTFGGAAGAARAVEGFVIRDVLAGRVEAGTL